MEQRIEYKGMTSQPSDYACGDGEMKLAVNAEYRDGGYHAVRVPKENTTIDGEPIYVFHASDGEKILYIKDGSLYYNDTSITTITSVTDICNIGNVIVLLDNGKKKYIRYMSDNTFKYIGDEIPKIELSFKAAQAQIGFSTIGFGEDWEEGSNLYGREDVFYESNYRNMLHGVNTSSGYTMPKLSAYTPSLGKDYHKETYLKKQEAWGKLEELLVGELNKKRTQYNKKDYLFYPHLLKYAIKLYDGSYVNVSEPIPTLLLNDTTGIIFSLDNENKIKSLWIEYTLYDLWLRVESADFYNGFSDIIDSIDIFMTEPIYTCYDELDCDLSDDRVPVINKLYFRRKNMYEGVKNATTYHKLFSIPFEKIAYYSVFRRMKNSEEGIYVDYKEKEILETSTTIEADYTISNIYSYNNRLLESRTNKNNKYTICNSYCGLDVIKNHNTSYCRENDRLRSSETTFYNYNIKLNKDDCIQYLKYKVGDNVYWKKIGNKLNGHTHIMYAKSSKPISYVVFQKNDSSWYSEYIFDFAETLDANVYVLAKQKLFESLSPDGLVQELPEESTPPASTVDDTLNCSEANNPFSFSNKNVVAISDVIAIRAVTMETSRGQFGQYPVFVFAKDATYAVNIGNDGTMQSVVPYSYDILNNKHSVANMGRSVVFCSKRGVVLFDNSGESKLLLKLDKTQDYAYDKCKKEHQKQFVESYLSGDTMSFGEIPDYKDLSTYMNGGARFAYDYSHERLIVYNPQYNYSYIMDSQSGFWSIFNQGFSNNLYIDNQCCMAKVSSRKIVTEKTEIKNVYVRKAKKISENEARTTIITILTEKTTRTIKDSSNGEIITEVGGKETTITNDEKAVVTNDKIIFDTTIETVTKDIMTGKSETKQETDHQESDKEAFPNFMEEFVEEDIKQESESDPIIKEYTKKIYAVYDYSSDNVVETQKAYLITRPFKLGEPDVHKSLQGVIQRGVFCNKNDVKQCLYASNDLYRWVPVHSSDSIYMRGMRGTGYKYFREILFLPEFKQDEVLHGATVEYVPRMTNKMR